MIFQKLLVITYFFKLSNTDAHELVIELVIELVHS